MIDIYKLSRSLRGAVGINRAPVRIDQPAERHAIFNPLALFVFTRLRRSVGEVSSTTKSGHSGRKRFFCSMLCLRQEPNLTRRREDAEEHAEKTL